MSSPTQIPQMGEIIRTYRNKTGMKQAELARRIGVTRNTIANWENNVAKPELRTIPAICDTLEMPMQILFGFADPPGYSSDERLLIEKYRQMEPFSKTLLSKIVDVFLQEHEE